MFYYIYLFILPQCVSMSTYISLLCGGQSQFSVSSLFYHAALRDQTLDIRLGGRFIYQLSHLASPRILTISPQRL